MNLGTRFAIRTRLLAAAVMVALCSLVFSTMVVGGSASGAAVAPTAVSYVVSPHPDDEFQGWSLVENSPSNYKVFILLTHGEETGFCDLSKYTSSGYDPPFERAANPTPQGRWTDSCSSARLNSWRTFIAEMAETDSTLPGQLVDLGSRGPFSSAGVTVCRRDNGNDGPCDVNDRTAKVWHDTQGRGALVAFNLGDGDLTVNEVTWAIDTVRQNRAALGLDTSLPEHNIIGAAFSNRQYTNCFKYEHGDHYAVHSSLYNHNFGVNYQVGATCKSDPDAVLDPIVTSASVQKAFEVDSSGFRIGAHVNNYGWLHAEYYPIDRNGQDELFHAEQSFWRRF